jgi:hypothetical protein
MLAGKCDEPLGHQGDPSNLYEMNVWSIDFGGGLPRAYRCEPVENPSVPATFRQPRLDTIATALQKVWRRIGWFMYVREPATTKTEKGRRPALNPANTRARLRLVAHLGSGCASAVRADRRRTVSGDVRRDGRIWLSHADSVRPGQVGSSNRVGLQVGGRGFESRTLHLKKERFCRSFMRHGVSLDNGGASAVRADLRNVVERSRVRSSQGVCRP